jgi:hypothetical protein
MRDWLALAGRSLESLSTWSGADTTAYAGAMLKRVHVHLRVLQAKKADSALRFQAQAVPLRTNPAPADPQPVPLDRALAAERVSAIKSVVNSRKAVS